MKSPFPSLVAAIAFSLSLALSSCATAPTSGVSGPAIADDSPTETYDLSKLDQVPVPISQVRPNYPFALRKAGVTGQAVVGFIVGKNGNVLDAYAVNATAPEFAAAAVDAVAKWKFRPGRKNGREVATRLQVPITFSVSSQ